MFNNLFSENGAVYETMWKNIVQPDRSQMTIRRMRFACWIVKATDTHSEYVIRIALSRQQLVHCLSCSILQHINVCSNYDGNKKILVRRVSLENVHFQVREADGVIISEISRKHAL